MEFQRRALEEVSMKILLQTGVFLNFINGRKYSLSNSFIALSKPSPESPKTPFISNIYYNIIHVIIGAYLT